MTPVPLQHGTLEGPSDAKGKRKNRAGSTTLLPEGKKTLMSIKKLGKGTPENKPEDESSPGLPHLTTGTLPSMSGWESHSTIVF